MPTSPMASQIHLSSPLSSASKHPESRCYIIYFITGNPGLIEYYRTFLTHLYGLLTASPQPDSPTFHVYGRSLSGFEVDSALPTKTPLRSGRGPPFSLQEQVEQSQAALERLVREVEAAEGGRDVRVVLIGHSVGSWILLEILRRVRAKTEGEGVRIVGGVCLFPTVVDIAKSESGRKATFLLTHPSTPQKISLLSYLLLLLPHTFLALLIRLLLSHPPPAAHITATFLKRPHAIHQALHMARDEMYIISTDAWDADIWGAAHAPAHAHGRPVLRFLFAESDHWVADETRDALIRARGRRDGEEEEGEVEEWRPVMEVDEREGWPHGFCIEHSVPVAERAIRYLRDVLERDA